MQPKMFLVLVSFVKATVYYEERFDDDDWEQRWVYSRFFPTKGQAIRGTFRLTSGSFYGNQRVQRGLQTMEDCGWYQITSKFKQPFNTTGKDFVLQFTIRFEGGYECSGGYVKLLGPDTRPLKFNSDSPYYLMFGPDVCKPNAHKLMFLINRNGTNYDIHHLVDVFHDELTHSYTLIIFANRSYEVRLDGEKAIAGNLDHDFETSGTALIADPEDLMPEDWDNREEIPDPEDFKPETWDDREAIPDPNAAQPPEWREHIQGKWTPPFIQNPDYLGVWKPRMIPNPNYKGEWVPRLIPNPSYLVDDKFGVFEDISYLGVEVFQVRAGSIYDNFLVTDDIKYSEEVLREVFLQYRDEEFSMYKKVLQDRAAEEELKRLREKENQEMTDEEFYSSTYSDGESSETTDSEDTENFVFPSAEITDPPTAKDFEFPYAIDHNSYFINKKKQQVRKSSERLRGEWRRSREEKMMGMEWSEGVEL